MSTIIVTGGAGFIGSASLRFLIQNTDCHVVNVDKLIYAGHLESLEEVSASERYHFEKVDICDAGDSESFQNQHKAEYGNLGV